MAGGVDAFCIGRKCRGLQRAIRVVGTVVPRRRAPGRRVRVGSILGPDVKIGYAADWSEYVWGDHPQERLTGDSFFELSIRSGADRDRLRRGIDKLMPVSDWRDGDDHADAGLGVDLTTSATSRRMSPVARGTTGTTYAPEAEAIQLRTPITDGAYGEPWVFRYKDLVNWWSNTHHDRVGGVRNALPTSWVPRSKPIWFTEIGCAAIDKGTNQPNKFLDPNRRNRPCRSTRAGHGTTSSRCNFCVRSSNTGTNPANNPVSPL